MQKDNKDKDLRLQGQEKYLSGEKLIFKNYADKNTKTDHDHCEFCSEKFSETLPDCLRSGYTTTDDYHWVCEKCYSDFKESFNWKE
ncbi:hypothetical protein [uncultured Draconibacterium sp.]|uniref:hypothetical protein n=1 Tax=uncultured Draconibacterium sp. TaxID=1573823 RepID=UPI003217832A